MSMYASIIKNKENKSITLTESTRTKIEKAYTNEEYNFVVKLFSEYVLENSNNVDIFVYYIYAKSLIKLDKEEDAIKILKNIIRLDKNDFGSHLELGKYMKNR